MATYKDILQLVDKVSQPLKKISDNAQKAQGKLEKLKGVAGKLSKAFMAVSATVVALGGALIRGANQVAQMGDRIDKMSQKIGMGRKAFQEWDYIMSQNGGNVETLQMGFKTLVTQIDGVRKGSKESINAFKSLGVAVKDNNGQFRSADDVFNDTVRALQKIQNPTQKMILANKLFGRSASELRPLLNQEAEAVDKLRQKANDMGLIISDEDVENSVKFKDTMDTFTMFFQAKFATVMMKLMPELSKTLEDLMQFAKENEDVFNSIGEAIKWIVTKALPAVIKGTVWVGNILKAIGGYIGNRIGEIMSVPTLLSIAFNELKTRVILVFMSIWNFLQKIIEGVKWVVDKVPFLNRATGGGSVRQSQTNNTTNNNTSITNNYGSSISNAPIGSRFNPAYAPPMG